MLSTSASATQCTQGLGLQYRLLVFGYVAMVVLFSYQEGTTAFAKLAAGLLGASFVILVVASGRKIHVPMTFRIWAVWFFFALVSTLLADHMSLGRLVTLVQLSGVGLIITNLLIWHGDTRFYLVAFIGAATVSTIWIMFDPNAAGGSERAAGHLSNANRLGFVLTIGMVLALVNAIAVKNWFARVTLSSLAVLFLSLLVQTGSRKAMIAGVVIGGGIIAVAYIYHLRVSNRGSITLPLVAIMAALFSAIGYLMASPYWHRTERALRAFSGDMSDADGSLIERWWMIKRGIELWLERPLLGIGIDNYRWASQADHFYAGMIGGYSHSNYIEILVSTGLAGLLIYLGIYAIWITTILRLRHLLTEPRFFLRFTSVAAVAGILIAWDFAAVSYYGKLYWLLFPWIVAELHLLKSESVSGRRQATSGGAPKRALPIDPPNTHEGSLTSRKPAGISK
jgi:O-antigen ligase